MSAVWEHAPHKGSELLTLLALADYSDDEGTSIHPAMSTIARKVRLTKSQAQRIVHGLILDGWLSVIGNANGGAPGATRHYRLNLEKLASTARVDATPQANETGSADATGRVDATGSADAADGSRACGETGSAHATQSVIRTTKEPPEGARAACPHADLVKLYHEALPENPKCMALSDSRKRHLAARWVFWRDHGKYATLEEGLAWWGRFFRYVSESAFLTGNAAPQPGRAPFVADIDFLTGAERHVQIVEGKYHDATMAAAA